MGGLGEIVKAFKEGRVEAPELAAALATSELYCRRGETPGFVAWGRLGEGWVSLYSSLETLAAGEGPCPWFSGPGGELLAQLDRAYGAVLDPGTDSQLVLARPRVGEPA